MITARVPKNIDKYELLEEIGCGGMATVYRARDTRLQREVAVKLIHRHLREQLEVGKRFESEARAVAKLRHPNIVNVYDVSEGSEQDRYLVVELVRGETLRDLLTRSGRLPPEFAAQVVLEICSALDHAHSAGVIHRDVKPENVLIELPRGAQARPDDEAMARIKLTDFGIAKLLDAQGVTSTGQVLGSPAHMAPEQIEGRAVTESTDVFSLGVLFYECVVGRLPFFGTNPAQVLRNVLDGNFSRPHDVVGQVGEGISLVIETALQRNPGQRYATISDFSSAIVEQLQVTKSAPSRVEITRYLVNPKDYEQRFNKKIVPLLVEAGCTAVSQKQHRRAAALFNRALAYRPGDRELLKRISGLRRGQELKRMLVLAAGLLGLGAIALLLWRGTSSLRDGRPTSALDEAAVLPDEAPPPNPQGALSASPGASANASGAATLTGSERQGSKAGSPLNGLVPSETPGRRGAKSPVDGSNSKRRPGKARRAQATPVAKDPPETRSVSVKILGAAGGSVRIDGTERPWFGGIVHELAVGRHVFEFVPPNEQCCRSSRQSVTVESGEEVQVIVGRIPYRPAGLTLLSPESAGMTLSCPTLFAGQLNLPGQRTVAMSQPRAQGTCTFSGEGQPTRSRRVTLRAGQTTALTWP